MTDQDVKDRWEWAKKHAKRSAGQWIVSPNAIIDNKHFQLFTHQDGREYAARRRVRGAYQSKPSQPRPYLVRPKSSMKYPAKGVTVTAAVVKGKIRMWEYVDGVWNAEAAACMYKGPLVTALKRAFPEKTSQKNPKFTVLEDSDPAGYKSRKALDAKAEVGITTNDLPRHSPDLNVLDYSLWAAINKRMREQEANFAKCKKETAEEYKKRLRRTALTLPSSEVRRAVGDMRRRCLAVVGAKGSLFNE